MDVIWCPFLWNPRYKCIFILQNRNKLKLRTMKTFAISIPKPCHEDWNKMTPDAKGAFCGSCQKSVYDFSKKTDEEIIAVFEKEEKGKVCGRFTPAQLSQPVVSYGNPTITSRLAIFAYALLMVFGAALFNGADAYGQEMTKGEMKVKMMGKPVMRPIETPVANAKEVTKDTIKEGIQPKLIKCGLNVRGQREDIELMSLGQMMVVETVIETPPPTIYGDTIIEEPIYLKMGEVEYVEPVMLTGDTIYEEIPLTIGVDTLAVEEITEELINVIEPIPFIESESMIMVAGGVSYYEIVGEIIEPIVPIEEVIEIDSTITETVIIPEEETTEDKLPIVAETVILPPTELEVKVSPNPSSGQITLSYNLENTMSVRIELFDITGKMVRTLSNQGKQYAGKYNVSYNISDLPNGIYMATLTTDDNKVTTKVILTR